jgi:hypothetical protein
MAHFYVFFCISARLPFIARSFWQFVAGESQEDSPLSEASPDGSFLPLFSSLFSARIRGVIPGSFLTSYFYKLW